jgi:hypothetical protein
MPIDLPHYLTYEISVSMSKLTGLGSQIVTVHSSFHVVREKVLPGSWSLEFTHADIIKDVGPQIEGLYGLNLVYGYE